MKHKIVLVPVDDGTDTRRETPRIAIDVDATLRSRIRQFIKSVEHGALGQNVVNARARIFDDVSHAAVSGHWSAIEIFTNGCGCSDLSPDWLAFDAMPEVAQQAELVMRGTRPGYLEAFLRWSMAGHEMRSTPISPYTLLAPAPLSN